MTHRIQDLIQRIFGCWHRNVSRPFTISGRTYEVCLNCGKQLAYFRVKFGHSGVGESDDSEFYEWERGPQVFAKRKLVSDNAHR